MMIWRMQDKDGRGPFKPGFSDQWKGERNLEMPPIYEEIQIEPHDLSKLIPSGMYAGCACKSLEDLNKWFDRSERKRLKRFGYEIVNFEPDLIIAETITQVLFANKKPLRELCSKELVR